ncbi:hypothetical protein CRV00_05795 [Malaciobacter molluscorum]|uniref:hypothetical protein n=1 Tax=Malaciobacter molluscorum TaxID=1032072 RepID=UPI00100B68A2|nr:hypothetical protein [Malaciobacter molluscorum]RXJ94844.1 hypothetical protein CRV00_05795 [Malaciobacter molluscorum]
MLNIDTKEKDMLLDNFINKNTKDNTFTVKEIFKITKTLNYDFIDPIITSVFNDSYQYFTKVKPK